MGGSGVVSVTSNVAPKLCSDLQKYSLMNDIDNARILQDKLHDLFIAMFIESNPIPVKYALSKLGIIMNNLRSPMTQASDITMKIMDDIIKDLSLIQS